MRVLVLSDIHANLAALERVLDDASGAYEEVWCLGDTVGYGPEPDECIARVRQLDALAVVGNHDWAVLRRMDVEDFNPEARRAVVWTRDHIRPENLAWLSELPNQPVVRGQFTLTHGSPRDPVWEYVLYPSVAQASFEHFTSQFCLVGHTHVPAIHVLQGDTSKVRSSALSPGQIISLQNGGRSILNPGSVGQPRDSDPRASYALLDTDALTWEIRRVAYPFEVTQAHMRAARLPERLINRLAYGW